MENVTFKQARAYAAEAQTPEGKKAWEDHLSVQLKAKGILSDVLEPGDGSTHPKRGDKVAVMYVGTLASTGTQFDASSEPLEFILGVGQVIKGWELGVSRMSLGEHALLRVHSSWAYGPAGKGLIPGNADLDFDMKLISINGKTKPAGEAPEAKAPRTVKLKRVEIPVEAGVKIEGLLRLPEDGFPHGVVITHPHPKLGGNMRNNVVNAIAEVLSVEGFPTLAINFRGIGGSTGTSGWRGWEERQDVIAACKYMNELFSKVLIVGYSFGACVGCGVADELPFVTGYVAVSYPCGFMSKVVLGNHFPKANTSKPKLFILGNNDSFTSVGVASEFVKALTKPADFEVIPGCDHFWMKQEMKLVPSVLKWVKQHTGHAAPEAKEPAPEANAPVRVHVGGPVAPSLTPAPPSPVFSPVSAEAKVFPTNLLDEAAATETKDSPCDPSLQTPNTATPAQTASTTDRSPMSRAPEPAQAAATELSQTSSPSTSEAPQQPIDSAAAVQTQREASTSEVIGTGQTSAETTQLSNDPTDTQRTLALAEEYKEVSQAREEPQEHNSGVEQSAQAHPDTSEPSAQGTEELEAQARANM